MGKFTIIATVFFLYFVIDAVTLGLNKPLPVSLLNIIKNNNSKSPVSFQDSTPSLESTKTGDGQKAVNNIFNDASAVLGRFLPF